MGKPTKKSVPLKTKSGQVFTDNRAKQMVDGLSTRYLELYSSDNSLNQEALDATKELSILEELDSEPTIQELSKAIDALAGGNQVWKDSPLGTTSCLFVSLLERSKVPRDLCDAKITAVTAITIEERLHKFSPSVFTQSRSVASQQRGQQWT